MVDVNNLTTISISENFLEGIVRKVLIEEGKEETELSIAFVGPGRMKKINKRYRSKNRVTDILSFLESEISFEGFKIGSVQKTENLGEIVICLREVKKNAKKFKTNFKTELTRVLIHGIFHLLGYDHEKTKEEAEEMEKKQNYYFLKLLTN